MNELYSRPSVNASDYQIEDTQHIFSPSPVLFKELMLANLAEMLHIAKDPDRLRPHCKTHKMPDIVRLKLERGITKFKCATIAEAEALAEAGALDILVAYQLVGPNLDRIVHLIERFPATRFASLVDDYRTLERLAERLAEANQSVGVFLDVNSGMGRTGIEPSEDAVQLYKVIASTPGIRVGGIHWYDGHVTEPDWAERQQTVRIEYERLAALRDRLMLAGWSVPEIVVSGTGAFSVWAEYDEPGMTLSPGTTVLYDVGYLSRFAELKFKPALGVLTRVVSANQPGKLTLDLGHKSIAADQPAGRRAFFPELPDAKEIFHSEEHLVIETEHAHKFRVGDPLVALPYHVCPTTALHQFVTVIESGQAVDTWPVVARDRVITI